MRELAERWLAYAERDRRTCEQIKEASDLGSVVAFHIQQLIEKSLKALLVYSGANPPRIHDLVRLSAECRERFADLPTDEYLLERINEYYIQSRYPLGAETSDSDLSPDLLTEMLSFGTQVQVYARDIISPSRDIGKS